MHAAPTLDLSDEFYFLGAGGGAADPCSIIIDEDNDNNTDGTFSYTHDGSENFSDSFIYRVTDNDGQTSDAAVTITITKVSDETPSSVADAFTVNEGATFDTGSGDLLKAVIFRKVVVDA